MIMSDALQTLKATLAKNQKRILDIDAQVSELKNEYDLLKKNNEHISFSINLLDTGAISRVRRNAVNKPESQEIDAANTDKGTLRATVRNVIDIGESIDVAGVWERVTAKGIDTTRASINTTMHILAKKGFLERTEIGLYKRIS